MKLLYNAVVAAPASSSETLNLRLLACASSITPVNPLPAPVAAANLAAVWSNANKFLAIDSANAVKTAATAFVILKTD